MSTTSLFENFSINRSISLIGGHVGLISSCSLEAFIVDIDDHDDLQYHHVEQPVAQLSTAGLSSASVASWGHHEWHAASSRTLNFDVLKDAAYVTSEFPFDYTPPSSLPNVKTANTPLCVYSKQATLSLLQPPKEGEDQPTNYDQYEVSVCILLATAFALCITKHCQSQNIVMGCISSSGVAMPLRVHLAEDMDLTTAVADVVDGLFMHSLTSESSKQCVQDTIEQGYWHSDFADIAVSPYSGIVPENMPFKLCLAISDDGQCHWHYNQEYFHESTIARMHDRMMTLAHNVVYALLQDATITNSNQFLNDCHQIPSEEFDTLRTYECGPIREYCQEAVGLHAMFERRAMSNPNKIAVVDELGVTLTYGQLNNAANYLAQWLVENGATSDTRIAVLLPRSLNLFIALLATLKTGATYVPLDPTYPENRIQYILEDSQCGIIISSETFEHNIPTSFQGFRVNLTHLENKLSPASRMEVIYPPTAICHQDQASVMVILYTSGTTGKPKGVAIEHGNAHVFMSNALWDPVTENDVWAQMSNPCFIGSFNDIWLPLVRGASISIVPKHDLLDVTSFGSSLRTRGITCLFLTPKMLEMYADSDPTIFNGLNLIQFAGEAVRADAVLKLTGRPHHLQHLYGCTERTGCISGYSVPKTGLPSSVAKVPRLPIGKPIENTQAYVLDKNMARVPIGIPGELYIGGPQITRGYLNRDDATVEKFLPNPFDGGRMYKTGDMARWLPDGSGLDLLGRADDMIKLRGYRIELGEVEAEIMTESSISAAVVTTFEPTPGTITLAAYVTPMSVDTVALRSRLQHSLPSFMIPTYIIAIPNIPLNHNNKVDKRALPLPTKHSNCNRTYTAPQTDHERTVVAAMSKVLNMAEDKISVDDKFDELGGNSLMLSRLLNLIRDICPAMQLLDITDAQSASRIALQMDEYNYGNGAASQALPDELIKFSHGSVGTAPIFIVHGGSGFVDWLSPIGCLMEHRPLYGISMTAQAIELGRAHESGDFFIGLCAYYANCIRAAQPHGPYTLGGNSLGSLIALGVGVELEKQGESIDRIISMDMPAIKFNKQLAYATASNIHEKAPVLLAHRWGMAFAPNDPEMPELLAKLERDLDAEILGERSVPVNEDEVFVKMTAVCVFFRRCGIDEATMIKFVGNLAQCSDLFIDPVEYGLHINAPVTVAIASDNRLMAHTMRANGFGHMLHDYAWSRVTDQPVSVVSVEGDHVDMVETALGKQQYAACFDTLYS